MLQEYVIMYLPHTYNRLHPQIKLLEDTVRRECIERFELIEALGKSQDQLLKLQVSFPVFKELTQGDLATTNHYANI